MDELDQKRLSRMASLEARVGAIEATLTELVACVAEVDAALRGPKDLRSAAERFTGVAPRVP